MSQIFRPRVLAVIAAAFVAYGCASTPVHTVRDSSLPSCRSSEVLHCGANGICTCLTQSAAKAIVDNL